MTPSERELTALRSALDAARSQRDFAVGLAVGLGLLFAIPPLP